MRRFNYINNIVLLAFAFILATVSANAQPASELSATLTNEEAAPQSSITEEVDSPQISLIIIGKGVKEYQLEGHAALRIVMPEVIPDGELSADALQMMRYIGKDIVVNWGVFDFNSPNFAFRFMKGQTDYMCGAYDWFSLGMEYNGSGRSIHCIPLNLSADEAWTVVNLVAENLRPENATYRYNYVLDNCSTRPLAIIEQALAADGATLKINEPEVETTFRKEMRQYHKDYPWYQLFIDLTLGSGIDRKITQREQAFAPLYLERLALSATVVDANGAEHPLADGNMMEVPETLPDSKSGIPPHVVIGLILAASAFLTYVGIRKKRLFKGFDAALFGFIGLLGIYLTFMIFVSEHEATSPNINYLWIEPAMLLVPALLWSDKCRKLLWWLQALNLGLITFYLLASPLLHQSTGALLKCLALAVWLRCMAYVVLEGKKIKKNIL